MMNNIIPEDDIIVGRPRPRNNPLIYRKLVGKQSFHSDLPPLPPGYTFGAPRKRDSENVGRLMVLNNIYDSPIRNTLKRDAKAFKPDKNRVYGIKSDETTYMKEVMENRFHLDWVNSQKIRYEKLARIEEKMKRKKRKVLPRSMSVDQQQWITVHTNAEGKPHPKEYFTMKQFRDIPSRLSTINVEYCRSLSRNRNASVSRNTDYNNNVSVDKDCSAQNTDYNNHEVDNYPNASIPYSSEVYPSNSYGEDCHHSPTHHCKHHMDNSNRHTECPLHRHTDHYC